MSRDFLALNAHWKNIGLLGEKAVHFGGPDELLLYSGGPQTHLSQFSIICGPSRKRVLVRQPNRSKIPAGKKHSPLSGEVVLVNEKSPFVAELEEWKHGCWYHSTSIFAGSLSELLTKLKTHTPNENFETLPNPALPQRPFWAGAFAYDMVQWTQPVQLQHLPDEKELLTILWLVERIVIHDKEHDRIENYALPGDTWSAKISENMEAYEPLKILQKPPPSDETSSMSDEEHENTIEAICESIRAGQMYQVNVGRWWSGEIDEHPRIVFQRLNEQNPAPFSAYLEAPDLGFSLVCSSPESLLKSDGVSVFTSPIKGTRPRGANIEQEKELRLEMVNDEKERAEHRMLVDLMRNDISTVAEVGSVKVERFDVEAYSQVQHLVSHLSATLKEDSNGLTALQAVFPGGSITGCPRTVVCAAIDELEKRPRSFWTGSIGWIDVFSGASSWNILIRTLIAQKRKEKWFADVAAGGGITIGSHPKTEVQEAKWKAAALRKACGWIEGDEKKLPTGELKSYRLDIEGVPPASLKAEVRFVDGETDAKGCVLLIDNLDSFTLNIAHAIAGLGHEVLIYRAREGATDSWDASSCGALINRLQPSHIVLGPGPGVPTDSPLTMELAHAVLEQHIKVPLLGICLGHQALGVAAGMELIRAPNGPVHGAPRSCEHAKVGVFSTLQSPTSFTRYNSLAVTSTDASPFIETAHEEGTRAVMAIQHPVLQIHGVQFHPESVGSKEGLELLKSFLASKADA